MLGVLNPLLRGIAKALPNDSALRGWARRQWNAFLEMSGGSVQVELHGEKIWLSADWRSIDSEYEAEAISSLLSELTVGSTLWDVGAHIGLYSIMAARKVGPTGKIVGWEPSPKAFAQLRTHLKLNHLESCTRVIEEAISEGEAAFIDFELEEGISHGPYNRIGYTAADKPPGETIRVPTRSLDAWVGPLGGPPDVIKMGIHGAEVSGLRSGAKLFSGAYGKRPKVLVSVHPAEMARYGTPTEQLRSLVQAMDYVARDFSGAPADLRAVGQYWLLPRS